MSSVTRDSAESIENIPEHSRITASSSRADLSLRWLDGTVPRQDVDLLVDLVSDQVPSHVQADRADARQSLASSKARIVVPREGAHLQETSVAVQMDHGGADVGEPPNGLQCDESLVPEDYEPTDLARCSVKGRVPSLSANAVQDDQPGTGWISVLRKGPSATP